MQRFIPAMTLMLILLLAAAPTHAQENLLTNGGLEEGGEYGPYVGKGRGNLNIPAGWDIWLGQGDTSQYYNRGDQVYGYPHNGPAPNPVEGRTVANIHGGYVQFNAALHQSVSVAAGTNLTAEASSYLIACSDNPSQPGGCPSDPASGARTRVGIDPDGGTDPYAPEIVWSNWVTPHDTWGRQSVSATATGGQVTVFLFATQDSPQANNFAYWDDAALYTSGEGGAAAPASASATPSTANTSTTDSGSTSSAAPAPAVAPTATLRPYVAPQAYAPYVVPQGEDESGAIVHVVVEGDTFDSIAYAYGLTREELRERNPNLRSIRFLRIGQEIIIEPGADVPTATPTLAPSATPAG